MTQKELETYMEYAVLRVVIQFHTALSEDRDSNGQLIPKLTMFVVKRGFVTDWTIYALPVDYLKHKFDSKYDTMVTAVLEVGTKITMAETIREISGCDDEMFNTYRY
jgi:hypothetical protein